MAELEKFAPFADYPEPHNAVKAFHPPVQAWFTASFGAPTPAQEQGWPAIESGESTLILAPTGSGKTLAAFLVAIDKLMFEPVPKKDERCRVLYVSPLKALAVDVERNLRAPLVGVARAAERMGLPFHEPTVAVRTGDTPSRERAQFIRNPSDILITTPESLYLMLTSNARDTLRSVRWVIIDEIHAMVNTKRGAHLALSLERLQAITEKPFQRIGLSATQRPLDEVARFLGGFDDPEGAEPALPRPVKIVDAGRKKALELTVEVPVEDMARLGEPLDIPSGNAAQGEVRTSIWSSIHPHILDLIRAHRSTLIFVNSRRLAERLAAALNELAGEELVRAHHGSLSREQRLLIEDDLKAGRLPAMVATSSLELGIDMGAIDLVIQVEAPPSVASGLQRIGRAGHHVGAPSKGIILPKYRGDLLACAALTERMCSGAVEEMRYPRNPLDILAQQIVAMVSMDDWTVGDLVRLARRAAPFAELSQSLFEEVLDMLSGRYPSDDFAELRPRITWDRLNGILKAREGAKRVAIANAGTIPDRGLYGVYLIESEKGKGRVGELDEEMVYECHVGDTFLLGASSWRVEEITHDRVLVSPAPGVPGRMPFWHGEAAGRPLEFGRAIGKLTRALRAQPAEKAEAILTEKHSLTPCAARNLLQYLQDQEDAAGFVPDDKTIVVERYQDEMGDWRVCILSPFGGKVHAPWAMAIGAKIREETDFEVDVLWTDDGIVIRLPEADEPPDVELVLPDPDEVTDLVIRQLGALGGGARQANLGAPPTALFAARFREAAGRALLLPRRHPGQRKPLWQQRKRASELLQVTAKYGSFPIVLETYRECLRDVFDMPALQELLGEIKGRDIRVQPVTTRVPSPFAAALMFTYVGNFVYEGDAPLAERRAQALTVDPAQLRELLGEVELRELLDPESLEMLELYLAHLTPERAAKHADGLHDLLLRLGDLTEDEILARVTDREAAKSWIAKLKGERRIVNLTIAGEPRWIAAEDAGRYRDALGIPPPPGLPQAFLEYGRDPLGDMIARWGRTHGPFHAEEIARRYGIGIAPVLAVLQRFGADGRMVEGEFRPGATGREWCDTGVLRALRQKSLARLRHEVEPVEPHVLGRLLLDWQGIGRSRRGQNALIEVIEQLQGASLPASVLESEILPARLPEYRPSDLDALTASGIVLWVGREPLGQHDGRISLYLAEHAPLLVPSREGAELPNGPLHAKIREHLAARGASFFPQIVQACGGFPPDVLEALWDLVWAGEVTNDMLQPLRAFLRGGSAAKERESARMQISRARRAPFRSRLAMPASPSRAVRPDAAGRWSLVESLVYGTATATERISAQARQLLERYGVLTREAVQAEGLPGGFSGIYPVLRAMEDAGHIRRGYFVSGLGAAQFAVPSAVDRLRGLREPEEMPQTALLSAVDPANPYGAAIRWPEAKSGRKPARMAGAFVILVDGALAAWMGRGERTLLTFLDNVPDREPSEVAYEIARVLADEVMSGRRRAVYVQEVDGQPAEQTPMAAALLEAGFHHSAHGYLKRIT